MQGQMVTLQPVPASNIGIVYDYNGFYITVGASQPVLNAETGALMGSGPQWSHILQVPPQAAVSLLTMLQVALDRYERTNGRINRLSAQQMEMNTGETEAGPNVVPMSRDAVGLKTPEPDTYDCCSANVGEAHRPWCQDGPMALDPLPPVELGAKAEWDVADARWRCGGCRESVDRACSRPGCPVKSGIV